MKKNTINTVGVKKVLPYGAIKEIAKRSNTHITTVSNVLKGVSKSPVVIKTIKEYLEEMNTTSNKINALVAES